MLDFVTSTKKSKFRNGVLPHKIECNPVFRPFIKTNSDISSSESRAREETWQALHWGLSSGELFVTIVSNWESYNNIDAVM